MIKYFYLTIHVEVIFLPFESFSQVTWVKWSFSVNSKCWLSMVIIQKAYKSSLSKSCVAWFVLQVKSTLNFINHSQNILLPTEPFSYVSTIIILASATALPNLKRNMRRHTCSSLVAIFLSLSTQNIENKTCCQQCFSLVKKKKTTLGTFVHI